MKPLFWAVSMDHDKCWLSICCAQRRVSKVGVEAPALDTEPSGRDRPSQVGRQSAGRAGEGSGRKPGSHVMETTWRSLSGKPREEERLQLGLEGLVRPQHVHMGGVGLRVSQLVFLPCTRSQWSFHASCLHLPDSRIFHLTIVWHSASFLAGCHTSQGYPRTLRDRAGAVRLGEADTWGLCLRAPYRIWCSGTWNPLMPPLGP